MKRRIGKSYELELQALEASTRLAQLQFADDAETLMTKWWKLVKRPPIEPIESANAWFKRNAYRFLMRYIDAGRTDIFENAITRSQRRRVGLDTIRANPFKLGLFAMFSDDSMSRSDRLVYGNQMLYAHRHAVPPQHLVAFIRAAGSPLRLLKSCAPTHANQQSILADRSRALLPILPPS